MTQIMGSLIHRKTFQGLKTLLHQDCRVCYLQHFEENKLNLPILANQKKKLSYRSTGASDRSFYPVYNERFDRLGTLLTICRPKNVFSAGSLWRALAPSPQSKWHKRTFMLLWKYHVSVSNMLSKPLKCFMLNEN